LSRSFLSGPLEQGLNFKGFCVACGRNPYNRFQKQCLGAGIKGENLCENKGMALHLKALDGTLKDKLYALRPGFVIGRGEGDLVIANDKRLSTRHAFVEVGDDGTWYLVDNGSKNGLRVGNEQKKRVGLEVGTKILIGSTNYEVVDHIADPLPIKTKPKARHWRDILADFAMKAMAAVKNEGKAIVSLHPAVVLDFIRGTQAETRWVLGYGPRKIGARSLDLPIYESGAPDVCFEILPTPDGISFKTDYPELVKLNGQSVSAEILHIADIIKIQDTEIEVDFIE